MKNSKRGMKYVRGRRVLQALGVFVPNYVAETVYAKLEARGYHWNGANWARETAPAANPPEGEGR